jgi:sugar (pentulose or hexulose) kinase
MLVVGLDASTTSVKAIAWDETGNAVAEGRASLSLENPAPDAWEQDAETWWSGTVSALRSLTQTLGERTNEIAALCVTHQRETFVLTDDAGVPLAPALVWMDARGRAQVERAVNALGGEKLHRLSGKPACITPSFYKLLGLLERNPELVARSPRVLDVHAFLAFRLTGTWTTSLASADPLGLVDMQNESWADELIRFAGLDPARFAPLVRPGAVIGKVIAENTGLPRGVPLVAGAGDGQSAGLGAGILEPGRAYLNLGTAVVSGVLSPTFLTDPAFRTLYAASGTGFFLESDLKGGTFTLTWLAEKWCAARSPEDVTRVLSELGEAAHAIPAGSNGLVLVPYWNGVMNPFWDDDASGVVVGFTGSHGPAHLYRAILEGIAFEERLHVDGVEKASGQRIEEMRVMGGGSKSDLWCQILADVLERPIVRCQSSEATALGAGILAAVSAGMHSDLPNAVRAMTGTGKRFVPGRDAERYSELMRDVYAPLFPALREPLRALSRFRA